MAYSELIKKSRVRIMPDVHAGKGCTIGTTMTVTVIGAVNMDICGRPANALIMRDSNPGAVTLTPGGVGRNIAHDLCLLGLDGSVGQRGHDARH